MLRLFASMWFHFRDRLRISVAYRLVASALLDLKARRMGVRDIRRLELLARAARACPWPGRLARLEDRLRGEVGAHGPGIVCDPGPSGASAPEVHKAIILKPPVSATEKGVLYVTFENQWMKLLRAARVREIAAAYDLVLGPTWSPPHHAALLLAGRTWPDPVFTLLSNLEDDETIRRFSPRIVPIPLLASSWTNPNLYEPYLGLPKTIDILMVATFSRYKRHWRLFDAIRGLPRSLRIVLIGRPVDLSASELARQARLLGVEDRIEVWSRVTDEQILQAIGQARVSLIFSRQEGSCVAVAESMMGGTPVGLFRGARIGSKAFINPDTGVLLDERGLPRQILEFLDRHDRFDPRPWAIENISCHASSRTFNDALRAGCERWGRAWTRDTCVMYQNSVPLFADRADALAMSPYYREFRERFGLELAFPQARLAAPVEGQATGVTVS